MVLAGPSLWKCWHLCSQSPGAHRAWTRVRATWAPGSTPGEEGEKWAVRAGVPALPGGIACLQALDCPTEAGRRETLFPALASQFFIRPPLCSCVPSFLWEPSSCSLAARLSGGRNTEHRNSSTLFPALAQSTPHCSLNCQVMMGPPLVTEVCVVYLGEGRNGLPDWSVCVFLTLRGRR